MKLICDFDDVLFHNTNQFKEVLFSVLTHMGIPRSKAEEVYKGKRKDNAPFSLKNFLTELLGDGKNNEAYDLIMDTCSSCVNERFIEEIFSLFRKEDVFIVTSGDREFQMEKIKRSGVTVLHENCITVETSKESVLEILSQHYQDEILVFVDDRKHFIDECSTGSCKNIVPFLYTEGSEHKLKELILQRRENSPK